MAARPLVGICMSRTERLLPAIFGTLAAGAAYLPLDPIMPAERMAFIVGDAAVIVDASTHDAVARVAGCPVLLIDEMGGDHGLLIAPDPEGLAGRMAYVIYTSGTTGKPKGS